MTAGGDEQLDSGEEGAPVQAPTRPEVAKPSRYAVVLHNDDYTTMEFVVDILKRFFQRTDEQSTQIMLNVHHNGKGVAGIYSYDIAETKALQVHEYARAHGYPLKCTVEKTQNEESP